jgi:cystathionine beta-lyase/cystathionine gamma-synthase
VIGTLARFGVTHTLVAPGDYAAAELAIARPDTRLFLSEAPSNPYLRVIDVARIAERCRRLPVRMRQHNASALRIAAFLERHPMVERVFYPGLGSHPDAATAQRQLAGFGGVISFMLAGDGQVTARFVDRCRIATLGASMCGAETLIQQPALMSHYELSREQRAAIGAFDNLVRLSVGLEDTDDLIADLTQALEIPG